MPGRSGDNDAGGMVWGSMIGKKHFGGSGLAHRAGPRSGVTLGLGGPPAYSCEGGGGRMSNISAWHGLHDSASSTVTISRYLRSDDERIQPQKSHDPLSRVHA